MEENDIFNILHNITPSCLSSASHIRSIGFVIGSLEALNNDGVSYWQYLEPVAKSPALIAHYATLIAASINSPADWNDTVELPYVKCELDAPVDVPLALYYGYLKGKYNFYVLI